LSELFIRIGLIQPYRKTGFGWCEQNVPKWTPAFGIKLMFILLFMFSLRMWHTRLHRLIVMISLIVGILLHWLCAWSHKTMVGYPKFTSD